VGDGSGSALPPALLSGNRVSSRLSDGSPVARYGRLSCCHHRSDSRIVGKGPVLARPGLDERLPDDLPVRASISRGLQQWLALLGCSICDPKTVSWAVTDHHETLRQRAGSTAFRSASLCGVVGARRAICGTPGLTLSAPGSTLRIKVSSRSNSSEGCSTTIALPLTGPTRTER
jgi:hypothetical protein